MADPPSQGPVPDASGGLSAWAGDGIPAAANEERFRHLVDENPAITGTCDDQGRVTYANRRLFEYTGAELDGDVGEWASRAAHPDDLPRRAEEWRRARAQGLTYEIELRLRRHDGVYRWFLARDAGEE